MTNNFDTLLIADNVLLYKDKKLVPETNKAVGVKDSKIVYIGEPNSNLKASKKIELKNHLLMPGLVNTHTHLPMSLFRGLADNLPLMVWLQDYIFPLETSLLDENFIRVGTELSAIELIKSGVTTCFDMYFYNNVIADVLDKSGLRAFVGVGVPSVEKDWQEWEKKALSLRSKYEKHPRITAAIAPHAPYTVAPEMLKSIGDFSKKEKMPLTIHVSESEWEQAEIQSKYNKTPVEHLHDLNVTGERSLFVHGVQMSDSDLDIMAKTKTSFSYNPESNMKLSNGIAPIGDALKKGITVGLGTDGSASNNDLNMFLEMGTGTKLQALRYGDQSINASQMLEMATLSGAKSLGLGNKIGSIEEGKFADLIAVDLNQPHFYPAHNLISHLVYSSNGSEVTFSMCHGEILMENRKLKSFNESKVYKEVSVLEKSMKDFLKNRKK